MVGDLAGFVAAIYHRGIPYVQMPTTLLAQVDSSIGGKTAVNTAAGKNMIGAWHQPALVICRYRIRWQLCRRESGSRGSPRSSNTPSSATRRCLRCSSISIAKIWRRSFGEILRSKAAIVAADERETKGERALLNFGHTVGHAIERAGDLLDFCMARRSASGSWRRAKSPCERQVWPKGSEIEFSARFERLICRRVCRQIFLEKRFSKQFGSIRNSSVRKCASLSRQRSVPRDSRRM